MESKSIGVSKEAYEKLLEQKQKMEQARKQPVSIREVVDEIVIGGVE